MYRKNRNGRWNEVARDVIKLKGNATHVYTLILILTTPPNLETEGDITDLLPSVVSPKITLVPRVRRRATTDGGYRSIQHSRKKHLLHR